MQLRGQLAAVDADILDCIDGQKISQVCSGRGHVHTAIIGENNSKRFAPLTFLGKL